ncbi:MAG: hypothetical protein RL653_1876 [Pseudomonadota bacterium]|jgi:hypothetical protein
MQAPALQKWPSLQSASEPQEAMQALLPLQRVTPHSEAGSVRAEMLEHVPSAPARLQARQVPVQAVLQQTPSTHWPEAHARDSVQATPSARRGRQAPASQKCPGRQAGSAAQLEGQFPELPAQASAPHAPWLPGGRTVQVPSSTAPREAAQVSHPPAHALSQQTPSAQVPEAHPLSAVQAVPRGRRIAQVPASQKRPALQSPSVTQAPGQAGPSPEHAKGAQSPGWPAGSTVHVPSAAAPSERAQAAHPPSHAVSQQTPSTHWPETHWVGPAQAAPVALFAVQAPASQWWPLLQSASAEHGEMQLAAPPQRVGPHSRAGSVRRGREVQVPTAPTRLHAWQVAAQAVSQQVPSTQKPLSHACAPVHCRPAARFGVQVPSWQKFPGLQSESAAHGEMQEEAPLQSARPHSAPGSWFAGRGAHVPGDGER